MNTRSVNLEGLSEEAVRAVEFLVETLRKLATKADKKPGRTEQGTEQNAAPRDLPIWPGLAPALEEMTRREIYKGV